VREGAGRSFQPSGARPPPEFRFAGMTEKNAHVEDMMSAAPVTAPAESPLTSVTRVTVEAKDTVAAVDPSMPQVASTPYLVAIAEFACLHLVKDQLEPGQITVGTRVVIDHLGPSKVGAELVIKAALLNREKNRFRFSIAIEDGPRTVAKVEHERAAVSREKIMKALG
jgi:fluoroacetyl-CoA thioesterase